MKIEIDIHIEYKRIYSWLEIINVIPCIESIKRIGRRQIKEYFIVVFLSKLLLEQRKRFAHNGDIVGTRVNILDNPIIIESI